ncbi:hypothetical protein CYY_006879 [Polysphondylium violaceum]|uniref:Uncharacterized protein n=1 Tax=Polysphondylium violaceum TaxID=133409 RepID=A0A8J4UYF8_9MYCE|nr:hypothetical protein CYY_006879 [Polysphondylium violaceum]
MHHTTRPHALDEFPILEDQFLFLFCTRPLESLNKLITWYLYSKETNTISNPRSKNQIRQSHQDIQYRGINLWDLEKRASTEGMDLNTKINYLRRKELNHHQTEGLNPYSSKIKNSSDNSSKHGVLLFPYITLLKHLSDVCP